MELSMKPSAAATALEGDPAPARPQLPASGVMVLSRKTVHGEQVLQLWDGFGDYENPFWAEHLTESLVSDIAYCAATQRLIMSFRWEQKGVVRGWDLNSGLALYCIEDPGFRFCHLSVNNSGTKFSTAAAGAMEIMIWDSEKGTKLLTLATMRNYKLPAFTADDTLLTLQETGEFHIWDADNGTKLSSFGGIRVPLDNFSDAAIGKVVVSNDSSLVAVAINNGGCVLTIGVWDYSSGKQILLVNDNRSYGRLALGSDNNLLLCLSCEDICVWDMRSSAIRFRIIDRFCLCSPVFIPGSNSAVVVKLHKRKRIICKLDVTSAELEEHSKSTVLNVVWASCVPTAILL
jgi:WD40 repeat protein